jgi:tetratricopeptide (TPR) repeat protein
MATDVLFLLSAAHLELGRSAAAVELLRGKVDGRPRLALNLARALHLGGDAAAALEVLGPYAEPVRTTDVDALPPGATRSLAASIVLEEGRLLLETERPEAAVASLTRATELDPWSREGWQELARAHAATGDREAAERALEHFRELAEAKERAEVPGLAGRRRLTDATGGRLAEAVEWAERGEAEKALTIIRQEISLAPDDPRPRLLEIRTLLAEGRLEEARGSAEAVVERFPDQPDAHHFRAVVALADGDLETAAAELRRALELAPGHLPAKNDLALLLARRGDVDAARQLLREILADHPEDPLARQRLQALEEGSDN